MFELSLATALESVRKGDIWGPGLDRKSTRLNSSHLVMSYAVFCLENWTEEDGSATSDSIGRARCKGKGESSMSSEKNVELVKKFLAALGRRDKQGFL